MSWSKNGTRFSLRKCRGSRGVYGLTVRQNGQTFNSTLTRDEARVLREQVSRGMGPSVVS